MLIWCGIILFSFSNVKKETMLLFIPYIILMFFAFMSDDMLEVQAGATFFLFLEPFWCFIIQKFKT